VAAPFVKPPRSTVVERVKLYLNHCASRNYRPSLKQVQSAIKRQDKSTGWTCEELSDVVNDLGFDIISDPDYVSMSQVKVVSCGCDTSTIQAANTKRIKWRGVGDLGKTFFTNCRRNAKSRNILFRITIEDAWRRFEQQNGICALSGVPIKLSGNTEYGRKENTASLDRIDSNKGYTKNNIQWVHKTVNIMKNTTSQLEFIRWCKKIYEFKRKHDWK
jgi:hypothetical protein